MRRLRDVGEHAWIARFVRDLSSQRRGARILVGPGDDAAVVRPGRRALLLTTDALIENVHFRAGWISPAALGRRAWRSGTWTRSCGASAPPLGRAVRHSSVAT